VNIPIIELLIATFRSKRVAMGIAMPVTDRAIWREEKRVGEIGSRRNEALTSDPRTGILKA
jgi:hypothetical protein